MTPDQYTTLRTALLADTDPDVQAAIIARNDNEVTRLYNLEASPQFIVWRNKVTQNEIMSNGFDWVRVDNLSIGKARIWDWLFDNDEKSINPSKSNVRAGIAECWKGTAADLAVQAAVFAHCKRPTTRFERVFATGTGTEATPGVLGLEGPVSQNDISIALNGNW